MNNNNPLAILMQMIASGQNPNQIINTMVSQNPQAKAVMQQFQNSGMSAEQFARQLAKQNGIDIDMMIKQFGIRR